MSSCATTTGRCAFCLVEKMLRATRRQSMFWHADLLHWPVIFFVRYFPNLGLGFNCTYHSLSLLNICANNNWVATWWHAYQRACSLFFDWVTKFAMDPGYFSFLIFFSYILNKRCQLKTSKMVGTASQLSFLVVMSLSKNWLFSKWSWQILILFNSFLDFEIKSSRRMLRSHILHL